MALRVGAENKNKLYLAIGLGVMVLLLAGRVIFSYFGSSSPAPAPVTTAAPVVSTPAAAPAVTQSAANAPTPYPHEARQVQSGSSLDPTLHPEVMAQAEATAYTGTGRNIFSANSAAPTAVKIDAPTAPIRPSAAVSTGPPPPPAIDLKFYGYSAAAHGTQRQIFLLHGEDIFLAREGDVVDRRYRVVAIRPMSVDVEDIPYHNTQSLPLTQN